MGLVNTVDMLRHAERHSYAVGAFNIINLEFLNGILEAADRMHSPVILNIAEVHFPYVNIEQITPAIRWMADNVCVPVVLNLDHGLSIETVVRALRCGFSSVMFDASKKSLEENIEETRLVVKMAHSVGVSVEAELGRVGGAEGSGKARARPEFFTNPDEAERFVKETGIDCLAVAVGNAHGFYEGKPELDFDLIATLRRRTGIPLVLHGGSGIPDDDFRRAVALGIRKINYFTEVSKLAADRVRELIRASDDCLLHDLMIEVKNRIREVVMERIRVFGSEGACRLPGALCPSTGACRAAEQPEITAHIPKSAFPAAQSKPAEKDIAALVAKVIAEVMGGKKAV
jgi:fructose-bisphosphate aldolase, class II